MKKRIIPVFLAALFALSFASCTKEDKYVPQSADATKRADDIEQRGDDHKTDHVIRHEQLNNHTPTRNQ